MSLNFVMFFLVGWLLMTLGIAMAIRSYREFRGLKPEFPKPAHMRWLMRTAFIGYLTIAAGHVALTVMQHDLTGTTVKASTYPG